LLLDPEELKRVWLLRKILAPLPSEEAMSILLERLRKTASNAEFLLSIKTEDTNALR